MVTLCNEISSLFVFFSSPPPPPPSFSLPNNGGTCQELNKNLRVRGTDIWSVRQKSIVYRSHISTYIYIYIYIYIYYLKVVLFIYYLFLLLRKKAEKQTTKFSSDNAEVYSRPFSMEELRDALRRAHDTSAEPDEKHYQMLLFYFF